MRSIRACYGDEWCKEAAVAARLGQPEPPNPLQHTNSKTTKKHYAGQQMSQAELGRYIKKKREGKLGGKELAKLNKYLNS